MGTIESYLKDAYNYIIFNFKKLCVGGLISATVGAMGGAWVGFMQLFIEKTNTDSFYFITSLMIYIAIILLIGLVVSTLISGYYVRVMRTTVEGLDEAPNWDNIRYLLVKGILYLFGDFILVIAFLLIPAIVFVLGMFMMHFNNMLGMAVMLFSVLLIILFSFALWFYSKLAEVNYSVKGFFGFFEFREIFKMISLKYVILLNVIAIIGIVISLIIVIPLDIVGAFLEILAYNNKNVAVVYIVIKILSYALSAFIDFYLAIFSIRAVALYYKDIVSFKTSGINKA